MAAFTGRLVVAAFEDIASVQRAAAFTAVNVYRPGDTVCVLYIQVCPPPPTGYDQVCLGFVLQSRCRHAHLAGAVFSRFHGIDADL